MTKTNKEEKKGIKPEVVKALVQTGVVKSLREVFDMTKLTNLARDTKIHYSTMSKYKNQPETIKTEIYIILADYYGLTPQEVMTLALNDMDYKPRKG